MTSYSADGREVSDADFDRCDGPGCTCDQCGGSGVEVVDLLDYFTGVEQVETIPCERCAGTGHLCGHPEWEEVEAEEADLA